MQKYSIIFFVNFVYICMYIHTYKYIYNAFHSSFVKRFRLSREAFCYVLRITADNKGSRSTYIPPILRLCATLEVLGGGGYQWLTGNDSRVSVAQSTLSGIVTETIRKLEAVLCPLWIQWRVHNPSDAATTKQWFYRKYAIPGVIGCVDGTHLFFQRPTQNEEIYFNRKGRHSLNAMIICDHKMNIMGINAKYGGSAHDSLVWKHSNERAYFENIFNGREHGHWLLG
ncbi:putative nuclease HARBI1 [Rhagoletis pomonella]|nr:putative nuclease HARBI1 [Rhagoletis pomonella]